MNRTWLARTGILGLTAVALLALAGPEVLAQPTPAASPATGGPAPNITVMTAHSVVFDVRALPQLPSHPQQNPDRLPEREPPPMTETPSGALAPVGSGVAAGTLAPAPSATTFEGLDFNDQTCSGGQCGHGHPPDTNGDVGPTYYIQTVNLAIGIFNKSTGVRVAGFTFDNFMSQGSFGNLCDTDNFGDPVVVYDTFTDHWIITDFAFQIDSSGNIVNPPGTYQCFAVSRNGDPVSGGWNFYSLHITDYLQDYPKLGVWPDGLYMSANMYSFSATGGFKTVRVWALNKAQMEAGVTAQAVSFNVGNVQKWRPFSLLPSNARLQAGAPPAGRPNYFTGTAMTNALVYTDRIQVWRFHVDWTTPASSTFTGPTDSSTGSTWAGPPGTVPEKDGNDLDTLPIRLMMQNQYSKVGSIESLWDSHTVAGSSSSQAAVRWYQMPVTGNTIGNALQASTYNPDVLNRWMPSLAVDAVGDMAIGYSTANSTNYPAIKYAGRLAGDAASTITQTEATLMAGTGAQVGNCGGAACHRWGDYSAMTLDPDGCTFWYTNEYYTDLSLNDRTRIGSFKFPSCSYSPPVTTTTTTTPVTTTTTTTAATTTTTTTTTTTVPTTTTTTTTTTTVPTTTTTTTTAPPTTTTTSSTTTTSAPTTTTTTTSAATTTTTTSACSNFALSATPSSQTVGQGLGTTYTINIARTSCTASITLGVSGLPAGTTGVFSPGATTGTSSTLTITTTNCGSPTPIGTSTLTVTGTGGGLTRTTSPTLSVVDGPPTVTAPNSRVYFTSTVGSGTMPVYTWWSACDPNGISSYQLERQVNGGAWTIVSLATPTTASLGEQLTVGSTDAYRVLATDGTAHTSAYATGLSFQPLLTEDSATGSISYSGTWSTEYNASTSGGTERYASIAGASATFTFTGSSVGWVTTKGPTRGSADIYVDGVLKTTVSLYTSSTIYKQVVWTVNFGVNGTHTIKVVCDGTSGHPRIDVDAFVRTLKL